MGRPVVSQHRVSVGGRLVTVRISAAALAAEMIDVENYSGRPASRVGALERLARARAGALERLARARAVTKLYGKKAYWRPESFGSSRGQVWRSCEGSGGWASSSVTDSIACTVDA
jgi:hypothetical protein